jgi:hypothetical protein
MFNLIPAFPLDGGRVLRALLALKLPFARATRVAATIGRVLAIALGLYGLLNFDFMLAFVALFIFAAAGAEGEAVAVREKLRGLEVTEVLDRHSTVLTPEMPAHVAFERLLPSHQPAMAVVDQGGGFLGVVTAAGLQRRWERAFQWP